MIFNSLTRENRTKLKDKYDYIIIGAGIGGLMFAYQTSKNNPDATTLIIERGNLIEKRKCPINEGLTDKCINCNSCAIMSGFSGCGGFSDAKYNITTEYGGWLSDYIKDNEAIEYMRKLDNILMNAEKENGLTTFDDYPIYHKSDRLKKEALKYDLHLLQGDVRHFGTDGIFHVMTALQKYFSNSKNADILLNTQVNITDNFGCIDMVNKTISFMISEPLKYDKLILAVGRFGAKDFQTFCDNNYIPIENNQIDIGVRVEVPRIICEDIAKEIYEPKIQYLTKSHRNNVRTFCFNPGGEVVTENTNGILTVNGHANTLEKNRTQYSNFAILSTHNFTEPFNEPINYLQHVAKLANMLGGGKIIAQLFGDLIDGRRSTEKRIKESTIEPTLKSYTPGDISLALPSAAMDNIIEMIYQLDKFIPGIANHDTLLYGIEAKYYSCRPKFINPEHFEIHKDVYVIGDGAGITRSLSQAGAMGLYLADKLTSK